MKHSQKTTAVSADLAIEPIFVSDEMKLKYPELVALVLQTESMDSSEKQYWADLMPKMNDEQIDRLFDILKTEQEKLSELENRYQKQIRELNQKHLIEWEMFSNKPEGERLTLPTN